MKTKLFFIGMLLWGVSMVGQEKKTIEEFKTLKAYVFNVKSKKNILTLSFFNKEDNIDSCKITLQKNQVLALWERSYYPQISLVTIPFKIRPSQASIPQFASSDIKNIGFNFGLLNYKLDRYFSKGTQSSHKFSAGIIVAPSVEELNPENSNNLLTTKSNQLFISSGLTLSYTYNSVTMAIVPLGYDFATTSDGKKWIYDQKWWWGFGLGIDTKLLGF